MAITAGTTQPMKPWGGMGGNASVRIHEFYSGGIITEGDLVEFSSGDVIVSNTDTPYADATAGAATGLIGVAMHTVADNTKVAVALALPGAIFEGNIVNEATDIATGGAFATYIGIGAGTIEAGADGWPVLNVADTALNICLTLGWAKQNNPTQDPEMYSATIANDNPRMIFVFTSSVFFPSHNTDVSGT